MLNMDLTSLFPEAGYDYNDHTTSKDPLYIFLDDPSNQPLADKGTRQQLLTSPRDRGMQAFGEYGRIPQRRQGVRECTPRLKRLWSGYPPT